MYEGDSFWFKSVWVNGIELRDIALFLPSNQSSNAFPLVHGNEIQKDDSNNDMDIGNIFENFVLTIEWMHTNQ